MLYLDHAFQKFVDNAEDLDIVMALHNLLEYSDNYSSTSRSFRNYYIDDVNDSFNENNDVSNYKRNKNKQQHVNLLDIRQNW